MLNFTALQSFLVRKISREFDFQANRLKGDLQKEKIVIKRMRTEKLLLNAHV